MKLNTRYPSLGTALLLLSAIFLSGNLRAQVPQLINYQGRVIVGSTNFDGSGQFKFALVNSDGTATFWSNDGTSNAGSEPTAAVTLGVVKGLYSVLLGDIVLSNMTAISASVFTNPDVRLRVWFDDGVNGSQLLTPDQRLAPGAYLADGAVSSSAIADAAITTTKVAPGAINGAHIAPASLDFTVFAVPGPPNNGQVLGYNNGALTWTAPGGGVFSLNGSNAYYNAGNVGIGTVNPLETLTIAGVTSYNNGLKLTGNSAGGTGLAIENTSSGGHKFDLISGGVNDGIGVGAFGLYDETMGSYRFSIGSNGNVGIGDLAGPSKVQIAASDALTLRGFQPYLTWFDTNSGQSAAISSAGGTLYFRVPRGANTVTSGYVDGFGMVVNGRTALASGGSGGEVDFGTPNGESGFTINGARRADLRFDGSTLKLVAGPPGSIPSPANGVVIDASSGNVGIGTASPQAKLHVVGTTRTSVLTITGGVDLAEPFQMNEEELEKGSVVVIDAEHPGRLKRSTNAYDRRVAGIVSGANGINPGISLHQEGVVEGGQNVALSGRVYVRANTSGGRIKPGDMLTTSDVPGDAMKASDYARAQGAVIGKAMSSLNEGTGMVLVLVTLQ